MPDIRNEKTCKAIKEALLVLLKQQSLDTISVAALCRTAGISRSTFYSHFENTYSVYFLLVEDFLSTISTMEHQLKYASCKSCKQHTSEKLPYCVAVRSTTKYKHVVHDKQYISTMLQVYSAGTSEKETMSPYLKLGLDDSAAKDLFLFQMVGCHTVATSGGSNTQWNARKQLLDTFIAGGLDAVRRTY